MAIPREEIIRRLQAQSGRQAQSSVAAQEPVSRPSLPRQAAQTSSSSTIRAAIAWPGAARWPGLMPYGDANGIVVEMAAEVLPIVKNTPVLAGVCGTDPFRLMPVFLKQLKEIGFSGVQNFPTVGLIRRQLPRQSGSHRHGLR